ncbi:MobA/MobL family protein [Psychrobacter celer]|uniref:MobA/MobL family protein n=1 Tax=Psychrobacter celer TaxID=306572 RepID=UPI0018DFFAC1|nr:MobA/MobL family protein [Psychrobacter celer]
MSIYRLEKKSISRGNGSNLCAAVAYRGGLEVTDTNEKNENAKTHDYRNKSDVAHVEVVAGADLMIDAIDAGASFDVASIAQLVENTETTKRGAMKKNAKLASEFVLAGSHELSLAENVAMFSEFAEKIAADQDTIAMVFVHDPKLKKSSKDNSDDRNIHAHIVMLSRRAKIENGELVLGDKIDLDLSDTERLKRGLSTGADALSEIRSDWADIQNKALKRHDIAPVTHKSYKDLGLPLKPTKHLGRYEAALVREGKYSKIGEYNDKIEEENRAHIISTADQYDAATSAAIDSSEHAITEYSEQSERRTRQIKTAASRVESIQQHVDNREARIDWADSKHQSETERIEQTTQRIDDTKQRIDDTKQSVIGSERALERSGQAINEYTKFINGQHEIIEQQKAEIDAKRQEQVQAQQRAKHKAQAEAEQKILGRTAFHLVNVRAYVLAKDKQTGRFDKRLEGDVPIGSLLHKAINAFKSGTHHVDVFDKNAATGYTDINWHLKGNRTAQRIEDFIFENISDRDIALDYNNLAIKDFLHKHKIEYDIDDLIKLNEMHPPSPEEVKQSEPKPHPRLQEQHHQRERQYDSPSPFS